MAYVDYPDSLMGDYRSFSSGVARQLWQRNLAQLLEATMGNLSGPPLSDDRFSPTMTTSTWIVDTDFWCVVPAYAAEGGAEYNSLRVEMYALSGFDKTTVRVHCLPYGVAGSFDNASGEFSIDGADYDEQTIPTSSTYALYSYDVTPGRAGIINIGDDGVAMAGVRIVVTAKPNSGVSQLRYHSLRISEN